VKKAVIEFARSDRGRRRGQGSLKAKDGITWGSKKSPSGQGVDPGRCKPWVVGAGIASRGKTDAVEKNGQEEH